MEQELGSIIKQCHEALPCKIYTLPVKEGFATPSLYVPPPMDTDWRASFSSFGVTYTWSLKTFNKDAQAALNHAKAIADAIRKKRHLIPVRDPAGNLTGDYVRIKRVDTRSIEDNAAQITLTWDSYYLFEKESYTKMQSLYLAQEVK